MPERYSLASRVPPRRQGKRQRGVDVSRHFEIARFRHAEPVDVRAQRMWIIARDERHADVELPR